VFGADRAVGHGIILVDVDRFLARAAVFAVMEFYLAVAFVVVFEDGDLVVFFHALQSVVVVPGQGATGLVVVVLPGDLVAVDVILEAAVADVRRGVRLAALVVIAPVVGGGAVFPVFPFSSYGTLTNPLLKSNLQLTTVTLLLSTISRFCSSGGISLYVV